MAVAITRAFRSGNSIAVRLPSDIAYDVNTPLIVERCGDVVTIKPATDAAEERQKVLDLVARLRAIGPVGEIEVREPFDGPERAGL